MPCDANTQTDYYLEGVIPEDDLPLMADLEPETNILLQCSGHAYDVTPVYPMEFRGKLDDKADLSKLPRIDTRNDSYKPFATSAYLDTDVPPNWNHMPLEDLYVQVRAERRG